MKQKHLVVSVVTLLILGFVAATYIYQQQQNRESEALATQNASALERAHSPTLGSADAKVTIVEFFDPACGTCAAFHPFVKNIMKENPGKIRLIMRYAPFHKGSGYVVAMLEASRKQNRFLETLETIYDAQPNWASHTRSQPENLWSYLERIGLDIDQLKKDMLSPDTEKHIQQDIADAEQLAVTKTPGFFVNGKPLVTFGYEPLQALIEAELKSAYK